VGHTKSLVVFADELLARRPLFELERAASFVGLKPTRPRLLAALAREGLGGSGSGTKAAGVGVGAAQPAGPLLESPWPSQPGQLLKQLPRGLDLATSRAGLLTPMPWPPAVSSSSSGSSSSSSSTATSSSSKRSSSSSSSSSSGRLGSGSAAAAWVVAAVAAMERELLRSDGLQKWPCGSVAGGSASPLRGSLLPNCSLPHASCFVSHDTNAGEHV
jgi:hypothetical protein